MGNNKYSVINLESDAFYRNIISITFVPKHKLEALKPIVKKGELVFWKLFGFIPLIPLRAKKDLYKSNEFIFFKYDGLENVYKERFWDSRTTLEGNIVYQKPYIQIRCIEQRLNNLKYFDDNESAMKYLETLKTKCKEVGNIVK